MLRVGGRMEWVAAEKKTLTDGHGTSQSHENESQKHKTASIHAHSQQNWPKHEDSRHGRISSKLIQNILGEEGDNFGVWLLTQKIALRKSNKKKSPRFNPNST